MYLRIPVAGLAYTVFPVDISFWILDPLLPGRVLPMASGRLVRTPSQCVSKVPRPAQKGEKVAIDFQRQELRNAGVQTIGTALVWPTSDNAVTEMPFTTFRGKGQPWTP